MLSLGSIDLDDLFFRVTKKEAIKALEHRTVYYQSAPGMTICEEIYTPIKTTAEIESYPKGFRFYLKRERNVSGCTSDNSYACVLVELSPSEMKRLRK